MPKAKKSKRIELVTMYIRVKPEERALIAQIAEQRGYPHNKSSVASEMLSKGLATEASPAPASIKQ